MDSEVPKGRARGRGRARPLESVESAAAQGLVGRGRGRATTPEETIVQGGRSKPRIAKPSAPRVGLQSSMAGLRISSSSSDTGSTAKSSATGEHSGNGDGNGNGNGNGNGGNGNGHGDDHSGAVGRGLKRGRPKDSPAVIRTIPKNLPTKKGSKGNKVMVKSNFFALKKVPTWRLYQYRVDMIPEVDFTKERKYHVRQNKELGHYIFDGTVLTTPHPICHKGQDLEFTSKRSSDDQIITVKIKYVAEVDPTDSAYFQFLNILVKSLLEKLKLDRIGRDFYDSKASIKDPKLIKHKLELYPGYVTSIRQHENNVLLGVEISHKILRLDTVYDMMKTVMGSRGVGSIQDQLEKLLLGEIVITKYNNKTYKISEIKMDTNPKSTFEDKKGNKIAYHEYYLKRWNFKIQDLQQPMIVSIPKEKDERGNTRAPVFLVPELCNMTGLSEAQRANFNLMKDLGEYTRQDPTKKVLALKKFSDRMSQNAEVVDELKKWEMEFDSNLQDVPARKLDCEEIFGGSNFKATYQESNADWGNAFRKWMCLSSVNMKNWVVVVPEKDKKCAFTLVDLLKKVFTGIGMSVSSPKTEIIPDNKMGSYMAGIDKCEAIRPELVMLLIPNKNNPDLYAMIKKKLCLKLPIPSQVVTSALIAKDKGLMAIATKIALQINCKLGGQLWAVKIPLKHAMVVGFDTYHDSQHKGKSVGALVASTNHNFTTFFSVAEFHDTNGAQEISMKIGQMFTKALEAYRAANKSLPERIFFYRDGVGDGQIRFVHENEMKVLKDVIKGFNSEIKITFIITSKRINTRFMRAGGNASTNPPSGTIVDDVVTLPERYDFFLVSQSVRQGTVNPTSYNVIWDESGLKPDHIQTLTYKLTHLYFNWPGTVRVPAPVQYAHKLAYLVGTSIHSVPSSELNDLLYYL